MTVLMLLAGLLIGCGAPMPVPAPTATVETAAASTSTLTSSRVPLVVFAAGSLIVPFDALEAAFEAQYPQIDVRAEYHGSIQVIRHATELGEPIDVVATADASLIPMLMTGVNDPTTGRPYADWYIRFASNRLTLAYNRDSKYAAELTADNWPDVLARPDVKVGIADPRFDAAGYRAFMAVALAQERARCYTYFANLFKDQFIQPVTLFLDDNLATVTVPEVLETRSGAHVVLRGASIQLVALLETGDLDYAFEYESVIRQHGLQMLRLPDEENLGSAEHEADYGRVQVNLDFRRFATVKPKFRGERIGYGITIPASALHPAEASQFSAFLLGPQGRAVMEAAYHPMFETPLAAGYDKMPAALQALSRPASAP
ncbi:MAG: tungstate ABC transporter substrate-binding protein WtpA [Chloroflexi bacterium]|nr:tungstate ABC transporter substrate-binding protein WtpA [Chloroflexota bacterium]